jgi:hypothetical protein
MLTLPVPKGIAAEIIRLEQNGIITPAQAASLNHNTSRLKSFFAGSLYGRIKNLSRLGGNINFLLKYLLLCLTMIWEWSIIIPWYASGNC